MYTPAKVVDRLLQLATLAYNAGYHENSNIVKGPRYLADVIVNDSFSELSCNYVAWAITSAIIYDSAFPQYISSTFPRDVGDCFKVIIDDLFERSDHIDIENAWIYDPNGINHLEFRVIVSNLGAFDILIILRERGVEIMYIEIDDDSDENGSNGDDSDEDGGEDDSDRDEDDFIDLENPPEYQRFPDPPPLYENIYQDELLIPGLPIYSEFSLRIMQITINRSPDGSLPLIDFA